jgi:carbonic anhydrase
MGRRAFDLGAVAVAAALMAASPGAVAQEFGYLGEIGPSHWSELNPAEWAACNAGQSQSPVNLRNPGQLELLDVAYSESTGKIFNNGHTVEIEVESGTNTLVLDGVAYELAQFHFHTPSEHRRGGRGFDMELHLVHKSAAGANAVVGVFLRRGASSGALAPIFAELPDIVAENVKYEIEGTFNPADFLPRRTDHSRYMGSLTTPPCSEGVKWVLMTQPVEVSDEDFAQFAAQVNFNARFTQRSVP